MNPDLYSDIRQSERYIFEQNMYLLNMFGQKVDSFINNKGRKRREQELNQLIHTPEPINTQNLTKDPLKQFARDSTKPLWNCRTQTDPTAVCMLPSLYSSNSTINHIIVRIKRFLQRYKSEYEDEGSMRLQLQFISKDQRIQKIANLITYNQIQSKTDELLNVNWQLTLELLNFMAKIKDKKKEQIHQNRQLNASFQEAYRMGILQLQAEEQILNRMQEKDENGRYKLLAECVSVVMVLRNQLKQVVEVLNGPALLVYLPQLQLLSELIHPLLIGIYCYIKAQQIQATLLKQEKNKNAGNVSSPTIVQNQMPVNEFESVLDKLKPYNYSKITFLNLDGYESPYNFYIAKYLSRQLQYISFPLEEKLIADSSLRQYFMWHSEQLIKQYLFSELSSEQKQLQFKIFKLKEKTDKELIEYYKQLLIFPVNSIYLSEKHNLANVELFQSNFIMFVMRQMIFTQIKEFNPSAIVISYSGKLSLQNQHFLEMVRELTIFGGMKMIFYCNLTKSYCFDEAVPLIKQQTRLFYQNHRDYSRVYERNIGVTLNDSINYDIFDKISIFLKMSSGTHSLNKIMEEDNAIEKYSNYKIMKYGGSLFRILGRANPIFQKLRLRGIEYLKIQNILTTYYQSQNIPEFKGMAVIPQYFLMLIGNVEQEIARGSSRYKYIHQSIINKYGKVTKDSEIWRDFVYRYKLELLQDKNREEGKFYARISAYRLTKDINQEDINLIAIQFQLQYQNVSAPVLIAPYSQICYDSNRKYSNALIYLFNHLPFQTESSLKNYYGEIDSNIDDKLDTKVVLREINLSQNVYTLNCYQHFTQFNYHETDKRIILFWPILYDQELALMHRFANTRYQPHATHLIFIASRQQPFHFWAIQPQNTGYKNIIPRSGCTCFQVPNTDSIYVFGGFYHNQYNYLYFQTDVTVINYQHAGSKLIVQNVPKQFYLNYQSIGQNRYKVTKLKNDFIRPRIQYEVYPWKTENIQNIQILLLGGVGQKFMRPYSFLGCMAHKIIFSKNGKLLSIRRMKLNGAVPVNLKKAVNSAVAMQLDIIQHPQNRQLYSEKGNVAGGTPTYLWVNLSYSLQQDKMTYRKQYEYAVPREPKQQLGDGVVQTFENGQVNSWRTVLRHYYCSAYNKHIVMLSCDQGFNIQIAVGLHLRKQVHERFINIASPNVALSDDNIISVDVNGYDIYALIQHPEYTCGRYVIAYLNAESVVQKIVQKGEYNVYLQQIYQFDNVFGHHIIKVLSANRVVIVHGLNLYVQNSYQQKLIRRLPRGCFRSQQIVRYETVSTIWDNSLSQANQISFFIDHKEILFCFTFKTISRTYHEEQLNLVITALEQANEGFINHWVNFKQSEIVFKIQANFEQMEEASIQLIDMRRCQQDKRYQLVASFKDYIYVAAYNVNSEEALQVLYFRPIQLKLQEYYNSVLTEKGQYKYAIPLQKGRLQYYKCQIMQTQGRNDVLIELGNYLQQ